MSSFVSGYGYTGAAESDGTSYDGGRERGSRRRKLAAMAGRVYNAGATAVNEFREMYSQTRAVQVDTPWSRTTIPGSFPDVAIVTKGDLQMVLFPSYAKRHVRDTAAQFADPGDPPRPAAVNMNEEEYWRQEWARQEDEKAIVDVDVRGWIYTPHKGPMTRRNRIMVGLARQLSGIPTPRPPPPQQQQQQQQQQQDAEPSWSAIHQQHEEAREQRRIAEELRHIERQGLREKEVAQQGGYSETPKDVDSEEEGTSHARRGSSGATSPVGSAPASPVLGARRTGTELSESELAIANANLMARIGPFLTTPLVQLPITVFFYDEKQSQSRVVMTNESGHFTMRAALEFVPTHVKILADEDMSAVEEVQIVEPMGVSLISDIDDTIKQSNISLGTKEIFRNAFVRDLAGLTVDGVQQWYNALSDLGVQMHYCSNSPWQMYPVLATFFKQAGLPPGSMHLKQYSGMLQGIFEPVAERKKGTLERIMKDFPERRFMLVGDSGEADLEVYTDIAMTHPGRILAIFIRDVTTPEQPAYFDSGFEVGHGRTHRGTPSGRLTRWSRSNSSDSISNRPALPPRMATDPPNTQGPVMGTLIDLSDEPEEMNLGESMELTKLRRELPPAPRTAKDSSGHKAPPPRPAKPRALQSTPAAPVVTLTSTSTSTSGAPEQPPRQVAKATPPNPLSAKPAAPHPLTQIVNSSEQSLPRTRSNEQTSSTSNNPKAMNSATAARPRAVAPPPPPARRRVTPKNSILSLSPRLGASKRRGTASSDLDLDTLPPPPSFSNGASSSRSTPGSPSLGPINKKVEIWRRRLQRAQETLDGQGVRLYTWRRGGDVTAEAVGLVKSLQGRGR
jgi:phosphatidate phosphatase APP1